MKSDFSLSVYIVTSVVFIAAFCTSYVHVWCEVVMVVVFEPRMQLEDLDK